LASIEQLHPRCIQLRQRRIALFGKSQSTDDIRYGNRFEIGAGWVAIALKLDLGATREIKARTQRCTNRWIQPTRH
jgi:hypothetical protein